MADPTSNPHGCCGVVTDCCLENSIPDMLSAALENDCGSFTIPIGPVGHSIVVENFNTWTWTGQGKIQCRPFIEDPCEDKDVEITLKCENAAWFLSVNDSDPLVDVTCSPFLASASDFLAGCDGTIDISITE